MIAHKDAKPHKKDKKYNLQPDPNMKLLLKLYSASYIAFCMYWFIIGCGFCKMKGDFELNFLAIVLLMQTTLAVIATIKLGSKGLIFLIALPVFYVLVIILTLAITAIFDLQDRKSLLLFAVINYPLLLLCCYAFITKLKSKN